jgi:thioredoxin 1
MSRVIRSLVFAFAIVACVGCNAQAVRSDPIEVISGGNEIDINKHLAAGKITLVEFYADWCGPCKMISPTLEKLAKTDSDIALCKIDIVNWQSAVSRQYSIHSIPCVAVFDRKGQLVGIMNGVDPQALDQYIAQAKAKVSVSAPQG